MSDFGYRVNVKGQRVTDRRAVGKLFQTTGLATTKLLIPSVVLVLGTDSDPVPADHSCRLSAMVQMLNSHGCVHTTYCKQCINKPTVLTHAIYDVNWCRPTCILKCNIWKKTEHIWLFHCPITYLCHARSWYVFKLLGCFSPLAKKHNMTCNM